MTPARVSRPWRTARPERGQMRPTWPAGICRRTPVATAARAPGSSTTSAIARRSAPAEPSVAYVGTAPGPSTLTSTVTSVAMKRRADYTQVVKFAGGAPYQPLRHGPRRAPRPVRGARRAGLSRAAGLLVALREARGLPRPDDGPAEGPARASLLSARDPVAAGGGA